MVRARSAAAVVGALGVLAWACGPAPSASPSPPPGADALTFERVPDAAVLHGDAVFAPGLVAVPGGGFLLLRNEDLPTGGTLLRSDDGRDWTEIPVADRAASGLGAASISDIAANDTTVVVLGTTEPIAGDGPRQTPVAWASHDGEAWAPIDDGGLLREVWAWNIVASPIGFAAHGDEFGVIMAGPDGTGWHRSAVPVPSGLRATVGQVVPLDDGFIAMGVIDGKAAGWRWGERAWRRLTLAADDVGSITADGPRLVLVGYREAPDPASPGSTVLQALAWESADWGATWAVSTLPLAASPGVRVLAVGGGFVAFPEPGRTGANPGAFHSTKPGAWVELAFENGTGDDRVLPSAIARSGRHLVLAGSTTGTGAGGDQVGVWVGEIAAR